MGISENRQGDYRIGCRTEQESDGRKVAVSQGLNGGIKNGVPDIGNVLNINGI